MKESLNEEEISNIIKGLIKKAHISDSDKEDLFQDLYVYYLQLIEKYSPEMNVPLKAFIIKFLVWRMWAIIKKDTNICVSMDLDTIQADEESEEDTTMYHHFFPSTTSEALVDSVLKEDLELVYLRYISGKSYQQLAEKTNLSIEGIRKKLKKVERRIGWENKTKEAKKNEK